MRWLHADLGLPLLRAHSKVQTERTGLFPVPSKLWNGLLIFPFKSTNSRPVHLTLKHPKEQTGLLNLVNLALIWVSGKPWNNAQMSENGRPKQKKSARQVWLHDVLLHTTALILACLNQSCALMPLLKCGSRFVDLHLAKTLNFPVSRPKRLYKNLSGRNECF